MKQLRRGDGRRVNTWMMSALATVVMVLSIAPVGITLDRIGHRAGHDMVRQPLPRPQHPSPSTSVVAGASTSVSVSPPVIAVSSGAHPTSWTVIHAALPEPPPLPAGGTGVWAVSIGVNRYANGHNLNDADNDADALDTALVRYGVPNDHRLDLRDRPAADIRAAARWLDDRAGPDAVAVFFFAGHVDRLRQGASLMGSDDQGVSAEELASLLRPLPARRAWIVIAGCFAGSFSPVLAPGRVLTAASSATQESFESQSMHRSYLVEYMIERAMVDGQASGSVQDAFAYAVQHIHQDWPGNEPLEWDDGSGPLRLGPAIPARAVPSANPSGDGSGPPPTTWTPPPSTTTTTTNSCAYWTAGVVSCR